MRALVCLFALLLACDPEPETPRAEDEPAGSETSETAEPEPEPQEPAPGRRTSPDGMCGGIAGFACPEGQWCDMEADHPDASGTCREEGWCADVADCEAQSLPHIMCVGGWTCSAERCAWECG